MEIDKGFTRRQWLGTAWTIAGALVASKGAIAPQACAANQTVATSW
jgi:hypothetical protein